MTPPSKRHGNDGLRKRCGCARSKWPTQGLVVSGRVDTRRCTGEKMWVEKRDALRRQRYLLNISREIGGGRVCVRHVQVVVRPDHNSTLINIHGPYATAVCPGRSLSLRTTVQQMWDALRDARDA